MSFRSGVSLSNHLVRAKVFPLQREKGSSCCGKCRCETYFNIKETNTFQSFVTIKVYKINHHFHCDSKCTVYRISCKVWGLQYVGWTVDRFRLRWNNYKCFHKVALEGGTPKQNYFHQNLLSDDHHGLLEDCKIIFIDKTDSSHLTRREFFWMHQLKTFALLGLNICDTVSEAIIAHLFFNETIQVLI